MVVTKAARTSRAAVDDSAHGQIGARIEKIAACGGPSDGNTADCSR
jgi:hypothetical protein